MVVHKVTFFQNCPLAPDGLFESIDSWKNGGKISQNPTAANKLIYQSHLSNGHCQCVSQQSTAQAIMRSGEAVAARHARHHQK